MRPVIAITSRTVHRRIHGEPLVGLNPDFMVPENHAKCIHRAGGAPVFLPSICSREYCETILSSVAGLFIMGGDDMDPALFNEEPHPKLGLVDIQKGEFEFMLTRMALDRDMPVLGICGGHQMLNVVGGGTIYQDIYAQAESNVKHEQELTKSVPSHSVTISEDSRLHSILGTAELRVNSTHHQAIRNPAPGFIVTATAKDGIIEAIEAPEKRFALGVQWHPESLADEFPIHQKVFDEFVSECTR
jgi:putative glutamine amidotransferase